MRMEVGPQKHPDIMDKTFKISSTSKTCDMSDFALIAYNHNNAESAPSKYSVFVTAISKLTSAEIRNGDLKNNLGLIFTVQIWYLLS